MLTARFLLHLKEWRDRDVVNDTLVNSEGQTGTLGNVPSMNFADRLDDLVLGDFDDDLPATSIIPK